MIREAVSFWIRYGLACSTLGAAAWPWRRRIERAGLRLLGSPDGD